LGMISSFNSRGAPDKEYISFCDWLPTWCTEIVSSEASKKVTIIRAKVNICHGVIGALSHYFLNPAFEIGLIRKCFIAFFIILAILYKLLIMSVFMVVFKEQGCPKVFH
jgi:hypothetical protein